MTKYIEGQQQKWKMECGEQKSYWWCRGMYLGIREGEGGVEVHGACRAGQKMEGAGSVGK